MCSNKVSGNSLVSEGRGGGALRVYRSRFQLIFVQRQSSVAPLVKPLIRFHCAPTSLASYPQRPFFMFILQTGLKMAPINNLKRRPGGQILYSSFNFAALIAVLVAFCLPLNCERLLIGLFFSISI